MRRGLLVLAAAACALPLAGASAQVAAPAHRPLVELVALLDGPPLARRPGADIDREQAAVEARIRAAVPQARIRWRYRLVLNGLAVVAPADAAARIAAVPGVRAVQASVRYRRTLFRSPQVIGAPQLWGPTLSTAGNGIKIGIIDDGVDRTHPFFSPAGFTMPPGFPKGQRGYTSAKVIVARSFPPPGASWRYAKLPFDPQESEHATHVAGIAAGDHDTTAAVAGSPKVSGIAPRAYIGNYRVLTIPTGAFGLDGNSPEIVAGIEAAVRDGMNVINLSLGEPEITPSRDIVVQAIDAAAEAGVVPVIAAGNDYDAVGPGSVGSPGSAPRAITAAAASKGDVIAYFSSGGPTPVSLKLKPDVTAPGVSILSSVPAREGSWRFLDGTSMAAPHVAGAAALLLQRHPGWTVADVKSALVSTGNPVHGDGRTEVAPTREGGGMIWLPRADQPLVFARPSSLSFGLLRRGRTRGLRLSLADAGGGSGAWRVSVRQLVPARGVSLLAPPSASVPGTLTVRAAVTRSAPPHEAAGFVVLTRGSEVRRFPYWLRVTSTRLAGEGHTLLQRPGLYSGNTRGRPARVSSYRYPAAPGPLGVTERLRGPEQVFRFRIRSRVENAGAAIVSQSPGVHVSPRLVRAGSEDRLAGYPALPVRLNPYQPGFFELEPAVGVFRPAPGAYDLVFDTPSRRAAGAFRFRFWVNDVTPPAVRLLTPSAAPGARLVLRVSDRGSGVDFPSLLATVDGRYRRVVYYRSGRAEVRLPRLARGRHRLVFTASDVQESKNNENAGATLPNTRRFSATFTVR